MSSTDLDRDVAGCAAAHQRLLATADALTDEQVAAPSLLPGWTVGHVLAHLARNADSHARVLAAADAGEVVDQYEGGPAARAAEIDASHPSTSPAASWRRKSSGRPPAQRKWRRLKQVCCATMPTPI